MTPTKRLSAEARKKQILTVAFQLIGQQGFKTVSMRDIAQAAQINEALIYRHFPTKAHLLRAILSEVVNRQPVQAATLPASRDAFIGQLTTFVDFFVENNLRDPSIIKIILYAVMEDYSLPDEFNLAKEGTFLNWLYHSIEKGQAEWGFDPVQSPIVAVSSFMGGLIFYILQTAVLANFPTMGIDAFKNAFIHSFLKSISIGSER
jgi:AcrR family transcriptional regulator